MPRTTIDRQWDLSSKLDDYERRISALERQVSGFIAQAEGAEYTPTFTGLTIGNGTFDAHWFRMGNLIHVKIEVDLGTTSSVTGSIGVSTPFPGITAPGLVYAMGVATARTGAAVPSNVLKGFVTNVATAPITTMRVVSSDGTGGTWGVGVPHTWNDTSVFTMEAAYQVAT